MGNAKLTLTTNGAQVATMNIGDADGISRMTSTRPVAVSNAPTESWRRLPCSKSTALAPAAYRRRSRAQRAPHAKRRPRRGSPRQRWTGRCRGSARPAQRCRCLQAIASVEDLVEHGRNADRAIHSPRRWDTPVGRSGFPSRIFALVRGRAMLISWLLRGAFQDPPRGSSSGGPTPAPIGEPFDEREVAAPRRARCSMVAGIDDVGGQWAELFRTST